MSDGFADQFGGADGKKFMAKKLKSLFLKIQKHRMDERLDMIDDTFNTWKGAYEQVDDVLIFGVEI